MASELKLGGVDELLAELEALVPDLVADARPLELAMAQDTAQTLRASYPVVTGQLAGSVVVVPESSTSRARVFTRLANTAPYAEFYEFGTAHQAAAPTFVPITRRGREAFVKAAIRLVSRTGLDVSGEGL